MASGSIHKRTEKGRPITWVVRYREGGSQPSKSFATRGEAVAYRDKSGAERSKGTWVDPRAGRLTVAEWAETWLARRVSLRPLTRENYERTFRLRVLPSLGRVRLDQVTTEHLAGLVAEWSETLAPSSIATAWAYLTSCLGAAHQEGRMTSTPWRGVELPEAVRGSHRTLTLAEVEALTEAMPPHLRALPLIGFGAGLRPGEILGLTVSTVEGLPPRRPGGLALVGEAGPGALVVRQQMQTVRGAPTLRPLKGAKGKRSGEHRVPVVAELVEAVRLQLAACGEGPGGLVFATPPGEPVSRGHLSREWRKAAQGAGVEGARPHDLRHSYATNLLREGVSVAAVSGWLGHRSVQTTLDTYWHAIPGDEDRGRAVVARLLGGSGVSDVPQDVPQTGA